MVNNNPPKAGTTPSTELDQESEQALLLEEAYQLGYHKVRNGCLQEPLRKLNTLITQERNKAIEGFITYGWGNRCKTKDTDDFPDLKPLERCLTCEMWEHYDDYQLKEEKG